MTRGATTAAASKRNTAINSLFVLTLALVVSSAIAVVLAKHHTQSLFVSLQEMHEERDRLDREWIQLLLEQSVWSSESRVDGIATNDLGMFAPKPELIIMVRS